MNALDHNFEPIKKVEKDDVKVKGKAVDQELANLESTTLVKFSPLYEGKYGVYVNPQAKHICIYAHPYYTKVLSKGEYSA